jgi:hypothetical protein
MRSGLSTSQSTPKPASTSPITFEAGTRTSSRKTCEECRMLLPIFGIGVEARVPSASACFTSTRKSVKPAVRGSPRSSVSAAGMVRVTATIQSAFSTLEIQTV